MTVNVGDKLVVTKKVSSFLDVNDIVEVVGVDEENNIISFAFGEGLMHMGVMNFAECKAHFEKYVEKTKMSTVTSLQIEEIMENSEYEFYTAFDKCTIVACRLPNGFVIVESSACVDPKNYDVDKGIDICLDKIMNKLWELEGYNLTVLLNGDNITRDIFEDTFEEDFGDRCDYECDECDCRDLCDLF